MNIQRIIITRMIMRRIIVNIPLHPLSGGFGFKPPLPHGIKHTAIIYKKPLIFKRFSLFIGQENSYDSRIISAGFLGSDVLGDFFNGK